MARFLRSLFLAGLVAGAIVALAVFLTPPLYDLLLSWGWIDADEFLKVTRRLLVIPGLLVLFAWLQPWRDGGPRSYGLTFEPRRMRILGVAYLTTLAVGLALLVWHFASGWLHWEDPLDGSKGFGRAGRWIFVSFGLALVEEWFFRGWMDRRFRRGRSALWAAVLVAVIYAAIHAFKPSRLDVPVTHDVAGAWSGFKWWMGNLFDPLAFGPTFLGLALLSLVLSAAWHRTRTLWAPVGIHAAGVFVLRSYGAFTDRSPTPWWASSKELVDGPVLWTLLLVLALLLRPRGRNAAEREG